MANIGNQYAVYNLVDLATNKYKAFPTGDTAPASLGGLIDASITEERQEATLYYDDKLGEQDSSWSKGTATLTLDGMTSAVMSDLFGHSVTTDEVTQKASDSCAEFGFAFVVAYVKNSTKYYRGIFCPRCKASSWEQSSTTKGESTEFTTGTLTATVMAVDGSLNGEADGTYKEWKDFTAGTSVTDPLASAKAWCVSKLTPSTP